MPTRARPRCLTAHLSTAAGLRTRPHHSTHLCRLASRSGVQVPATSGEPALILARGVPMDESLSRGFVTRQWICIGIIAILDACTLFLATWLFLVSRVLR
jgi:hypothetical protein